MSETITPLASEPVLVELRSGLRQIAAKIVQHANLGPDEFSRLAGPARERLLATGWSEYEACRAVMRTWWSAVKDVREAKAPAQPVQRDLVDWVESRVEA